MFVQHVFLTSAEKAEPSKAPWHTYDGTPTTAGTMYVNVHLAIYIYVYIHTHLTTLRSILLIQMLLLLLLLIIILIIIIIIIKRNNK